MIRDVCVCCRHCSGNEMDLLIFNIMWFAIVQLWTDKTAVAAFVTFIVDIAICHLRQSASQTNISNKTLVDNRFLF